ncbi:urea ABC transporter permease subunit UrtC [Acidimangrovimonas sediminis]|uniref:urea ABC transporter permease subunit UrtC n=1 Tax=Acidimangrovimonas sediminis TaxID=2056283 RepID=UPI000C7FF356|nr:urea ABC transporter permease subunit UrtC [Acidimangrovimonas sediminis]
MTQTPFLSRLWIPVVLLAIAAPWLISGYELSLLGRFLAMSILAIGLMLVWGEAGILTLGQGVFFGLGGYALAIHMKLAGLEPGSLPDFMEWSGITALPWWWVPFKSPVLATLMVVVVPGVFAGFFSWLVFRRRVVGVYFALITQALALSFATLLVSQQGATGGFNGLTNFQTLYGFDLNAARAPVVLYWVTLALVVVCFAGVRWLIRSRFGMLLRATRDGENRVRFLGYDTTPYKVVAFTLAAMLAGIGGALFTLHAGVISPALVGVVPSIEMVVWVAVGGRGSLWGAVIGTLAVNFAKDEISSYLPGAWLYVLGLVFILVVGFLPRGIMGLAEDLTRRSARKPQPQPVEAPQ